VSVILQTSAIPTLSAIASHIVQHYLAIDVSVFCEYLERLCSLISVQCRSPNGVAHNIMLPRSWLLLSLPRPGESVPQLHFFPLLLPLVRSIGKLLEAIQYPDAYHGKWNRLERMLNPR
jgi:hypothetical protein